MPFFRTSAVILGFVTLSTAAAGAQEKIRIAASTSGMQNVFSRIDKAFHKATGIEISYVGDTKTSGAYDHFQMVLDGKADGSTATRPLEEFLSYYKEKGDKTPKLDDAKSLVTMLETPILGRSIYLYVIGRPSLSIDKMVKFIRNEGARPGVGIGEFDSESTSMESASKETS